jgi:hypothetical protein
MGNGSVLARSNSEEGWESVGRPGLPGRAYSPSMRFKWFGLAVSSRRRQSGEDLLLGLPVPEDVTSGEPWGLRAKGCSPRFPLEMGCGLNPSLSPLSSVGAPHYPSGNTRSAPPRSPGPAGRPCAHVPTRTRSPGPAGRPCAHVPTRTIEAEACQHASVPHARPLSVGAACGDDERGEMRGPGLISCRPPPPTRSRTPSSGPSPGPGRPGGRPGPGAIPAGNRPGGRSSGWRRCPPCCRRRSDRCCGPGRPGARR